MLLVKMRSVIYSLVNQRFGPLSKHIGEFVMDDIFEGLEIPERVGMLESSERRDCKDGDIVIEEGARNVAIYAILDGEVKVMLGLGDKSVEVACLGPGAIFGEMSFLSHTTASASIVAAGDVELICVSHEHIAGMIERDPGFAGRFYHSLARTLAERLRIANQRS